MIRLFVDVLSIARTEINMISVIIPVSLLVKKSLNKRVETLNRAIKDLYKGLDVIVVEQSLNGQFYFLDNIIDCKKVKISYPVFNKGWMINVGVKHSLYDDLIIADCDMYAKCVNWDTVLYWFNYNRHQWGFVWNRIVYTTNEQRCKILDGGSSRCIGVKYDTPRSGYSEGGLVYFKKDFFYKIGQFNEYLQQLGGIDTEIIIRCRHLYNKYPCYPMTVFHLWHQQEKKSSRPERLENIKKIRHLRQHTNHVIDWLVKNDQGNDSSPLIARKEYMS